MVGNRVDASVLIGSSSPAGSFGAV